MGTEEPSGAEFPSEHDEGSDENPLSESFISCHVHSLQLAVNDLREKIQQITDDMNFVSDRLDNLEERNRGHFQQTASLQNSVEVILQRVRCSEEPIRNLERAALLSRTVALEVTAEHQAIANARVSCRVEELERLLERYNVNRLCLRNALLSCGV